MDFYNHVREYSLFRFFFRLQKNVKYTSRSLFNNRGSVLKLPSAVQPKTDSTSNINREGGGGGRGKSMR